MIKVETKKLHLAHTWTIARNSSDFKENVFVQISKDGKTGIGEAAPNVRYDEDAERTTERLNDCLEIIEKNNLLNFQDLKKEIDRQITDQSCAKAAIDMAILDWAGKKLNAPLFKMFGLNPEKAPLTSYSIGIDSIENMQQRVREKADMPIYKIKLGKDNDREIIEGIREVTDHVIRVDANEGWRDKEYALEQIKWLADKGVEFVEQPMPAEMLVETAWLKERSPLPLIADEAVKKTTDIIKLAESYHGINIKLMKSGGILEALSMIHLARAMEMEIMLGCMVESSVAISAAAQIAPFVDYVDLDGNLLLADDPYSGVKVEQGKLIYNDLPGLGIPS
ncbi:MAG: dipeptide epimerase [Calditrichaeota bacterium]|nr:MAG: dipeptide epimerase [Calditrichota bacterium]MBL1204865.1 dipeptide epimerase [Calditrichota bacterium]NOG44694.1 dipeptide epimerase [Calditrichota bacterium]